MTQTRPSPLGEQRTPVNDPGEIRRLRGCINDLISLQALPALWIGREPSRIVEILLEAMLGILQLDFAYAHAVDTPDGKIEVLRLRDRGRSEVDSDALRQVLESWLGHHEALRPTKVRNPVGDGELSIASLQLGTQVDTGMLVVGAERAPFPAAIETLLLRVAANQLTVALHEAGTAARQRRTAQELEERVAERTTQLVRSNEQLRRQEGDLHALHEELAADLDAMTRLHGLSTSLWEDRDLRPLLAEVLAASIRLLKADFGNVQLYDPDTGVLRVVAQQGFDQHFLEYFDSVREGTASCGTALQLQRRVIVEDVLADPCFKPHLKIVAAAGYRAVQSTPLFSRGGEPLGMLSTHFRNPHRPSERDLRLLDLYARQAAEIIERRRADERLRASEARFRNYFDLGVIGGALISPQQSYLEVNDELCHILGYEREELLQKTFAEVSHPDDLAADLAQFQRVLSGEADAYTLDKRWIRKDGAVIDSIVARRAVRRADGTVDYFVGLVQDITARKRADESLRQLQEDLAHVARISAMGELTASVAHEVNQPLAAVSTNADACWRWLTRKEPNLDEALSALQRIIQESGRANDVIGRIRALARKTPPQQTRLQLNDIVQEVLALARSKLVSQQISLIVSVSSTLPEVLGDRVQLQQVLLNLILNAIDAIQPVVDRPRELRVTTRSASSGEAQVTVCDSGVGLDSLAQSRLFEPFFTTKPEGMGLGLSISRRIVETHGGRLQVTPNSDYGTSFTVVLPAAT